MLGPWDYCPLGSNLHFPSKLLFFGYCIWSVSIDHPQLKHGAYCTVACVEAVSLPASYQACILHVEINGQGSFAKLTGLLPTKTANMYRAGEKRDPSQSKCNIRRQSSTSIGDDNRHTKTSSIDDTISIFHT